MLHKQEHRTAYQDKLQQFKRENYHTSSNSPDYVSDYRPFSSSIWSPIQATAAAAQSKSSTTPSSSVAQQQQGHDQKSTQSFSNPAHLVSMTEEQKRSLLDILSKNGVPTQNPTLLLEISSVLQNQWQQRCTLNREDIKRVFEAFGEVTQVVVYEQPQPYNSSGSVAVTVDYALITFKDTICAHFAQSSLNGHYLQGQGQQLKVQWMMPQTRTYPAKEQMMTMNMNQCLSGNAAAYSPQANAYSKPSNLQNSFMQMIGMSLNSPMTPQQFTDNISPQNHESSSTASSSSQSLSPESHDQRPSLLASAPSFTPFTNNGAVPQSTFYPSSGASACNQSMLATQCAAFQPTNTRSMNMKESNNVREGFIKYNCKFFIQIDNDNEFQVCRRVIGAKGCNMKKIIEEVCQKTGGKANDVKLRLRGQGSGFREGPNKEESSDPLHLCISSKYINMYNEACNIAEAQLKQVYQQYSRFCYKNRRTTRGVNKDNTDSDETLQIKKEEIITGPPGMDLSNIRTQHSAPASAPAKLCKQQPTTTQQLPRYATNSNNVPVAFQQSIYEAPIFQPTIKPFVPSK